MSRRKEEQHLAGSWRIYRRLLGYTRRYWPVVLATLIGMAVEGGALAVFTQLLRPMIDQMFANKNAYYIFWIPIWIIGIFTLRAVGTFASSYGISYIGRNVVQAMQQDVFAAYLRLPATFFGAEPSGQQISRITYTSEQVASASTDAVKVTVTEGVTAIGMFVVMITNSAYLTLALLLMIPAIALITTVVSRRYRQISRRIQGMMGSITGTVEESVGAHREVRIYGGQQHEAKRFDEITHRTRRLNLKIAATSAMSSSTVQTVAAFALALLVYLGTRPQVIDHITSGVFITVLTAMGGMLPSLKRLTGVQSNIQRGLSAAEDLFGVMDQPPETDSGTQPLERARGNLRFEAVTLVYPGSEAGALQGVDLHCEPGQVTALVGRSGSGKSSLVSLLPRFYAPTTGRIVLDDRNYQDYTLASLRRQIAWVGQNVVLFDDTVARNIAYGELSGASEAEIIAAAEAANAMEFITRLPQGIHTQIGQRGNMLSGGQRQRVAIARALLADPRILILDDATSSVDASTEQQIKQALREVMAGRTTFVIAHRLSTIAMADTIVVLEDGEVIAAGGHEALLEQSELYREIVEKGLPDQVFLTRADAERQVAGL